MRFVTSTVVFITLLGLHPDAYAQGLIRTSPTDSVLRRTFSTDEGLPQNTPTSLAQTADGYIWIATYGGLARFDGLNFKVITTSDNPGLINNRLTALAVDNAGLLWIGSEAGDLMKYHDGAVQLAWKSRGEPEDSTIWDIFIDAKNILWLATNSGLKTFDPATNTLLRVPDITVLAGKARGTRELSIRRFAVDGAGSLWMSSSSGLIRYANGSFEVFGSSRGLPADDFWVVENNRYGEVLVATLGSLFAYSGTDIKTPRKVPFVKGLRSEFEQDPGFVRNNSLIRPVPEGIAVLPLPVDVPNEDLRSFLRDKEGNIWLGTQFKLFQFRERIVKNFSFRVDENDEPTTSIIETPDGSIWAASRSHLLRFFGPGHEQTQTYDLGSKPIISLAVEPTSGTLWVGTELQILRFHENKFVDFRDADLGTATDRVLFFGIDNELWIGTKHNGLKRYRDGTTYSYSVADGLVSNMVSRISQDSKGRLWIGSSEGMSIFENNEFKSFTTKNGLPSDNVRDFHEDQDGTIWIGTYGGGLVRFRDGEFRTISERDGLAENIASRILRDDTDRFWILGNRGVYSIPRQSLNDFLDGKIRRLHCDVYDKRDGMAVSEGNGIHQPGGWRSSDGKFWFPMIQGGIVIDPPQRKQTSLPAYIEEVSIDGRPVADRSRIELKSGEQNLEIHYTGLSFTRPESLHFRYMLEGFDEDWQEVGPRRVAYYPYLPPGNFTFRVVPINGSILGDHSATLVITVAAPFWRTWVFFAMILVLVVGVMMLLFQYRLFKLEKRRKLQQAFSQQLIEAHESERRRIASDLHDGIGQSLLLIKSWSDVLLRMFDFGTIQRKDIEDIRNTASDALDETRMISANLQPRHLQRFGLTSALQEMIAAIGDSSSIQFQAEISNLDDLLPAEAELSVYRIVQECLNNIVKHSGSKNVTVNVERLNSSIELSVIDDGVGFDPEDIHRSSSSLGKIGLNVIKERVGLLGGTYMLRSNSGSGTSIAISIPIHNFPK